LFCVLFDPLSLQRLPRAALLRFCLSLCLGVLWFGVQLCSVARGTVFRTQFLVKGATHGRESKVKFLLISTARASSFSLRPYNTGAPQGSNKLVKEGMQQHFLQQPMALFTPDY
jgi:hypothetical protein